MPRTGHLEAIQILALREVTRARPSGDYAWRRIVRYYSETWHTPLHVVEELPVDEILQNYWEDVYQKMDEDTRNDEIRMLTQTVDEARAYRSKLDRDTYETWKLQNQAEQANADPLLVAKELKLISKALKAFPQPAPLTGRSSRSTMELDLPDPTTLPTLKFEHGSPAELEALDGDGIGEGLTGLKR